MTQERIGVLLVGHGVPATDCPPGLIGELMGLQWGAGGPFDTAAHPELVEGERPAQDRHHARHGSERLRQRVAELDAGIRNWPRHPGNDPYKEGLERLAEELKRLLPGELFSVAYNEFCRPSVPEALRDLIGRGATRIRVIPSMMTPGGVHSEVDIPKAIEQVRRMHPAVTVEYVWPFDLPQVAELLASHLRRPARCSGTGA